MISKTRPAFWRRYAGLADDVKARAKEAFRLFTRDPSHPSLHFKKLKGREDLWSARVSEQYRAVGVRHGEVIEWIWIGSHNDFDNQFS